jgi:hypothetical protein
MSGVVLGSGAYTYEPVEDWGKRRQLAGAQIHP